GRGGRRRGCQRAGGIIVAPFGAGGAARVNETGSAKREQGECAKSVHELPARCHADLTGGRGQKSPPPSLALTGNLQRQRYVCRSLEIALEFWLGPAPDVNLRLTPTVMRPTVNPTQTLRLSER